LGGGRRLYGNKEEEEKEGHEGGMRAGIKSQHIDFKILGPLHLSPYIHSPLTHPHHYYHGLIAALCRFRL